MHRDAPGDDHLGQHAGVGLLVGGRAAAAAAPGKQHMLRNDHRPLPRGSQRGVGRQKIQPGHRLLAVKHLHACKALLLPAGQRGGQLVHRVGPYRGVGLVQAQGAVGRIQRQLRGHALAVGLHAGQAGAVLVINRHGHAGQRGALPGHGGVDL